MIRKKALKILAIGSLFLISGFNFSYLVSLNDVSLSGFWKVRNIISDPINKANADADDDDDDYYYHPRSPVPATSNNTTTLAANTTSGASGVPTTVTPAKPTTTQTATPTKTSTVPINTTSGASGEPASTTNSNVVKPTPAVNVTNIQKPAERPAVIKNVNQPSVKSQNTLNKSTTPTSENNAKIESIAVSKEAILVVNKTPIRKNPSYKDGSYIGNGIYKYPGGSSNLKVKISVSGGKIINARWMEFVAPSNSPFTEERANIELQKLIQNQEYKINTISGATGTSNSVYDAISNSLENAKNGKDQILVQDKVMTLKKSLDSIFIRLQAKYDNDTFSEMLKDIYSKLENKANISDNNRKDIYLYASDLINNRIKESQEMKYILPNGNKFEIISVSAGAYTFKRNDGTFADKIFPSYEDVVRYLDENTNKVLDTVYTAPNGKKFYIYQNSKDLSFDFKEENGNIDINSYNSKDDLISYLKSSNNIANTASNNGYRPIIQNKATINNPSVSSANPVPAKAVPVQVIQNVQPTAAPVTNTTTKSS
ncbi:MAG: FMN-binding protein [Candidatus Gracilibacteria bacterium]|nr:FMN-binding protein [Candidatus Gracilibacteria bacterium]